MDDPTARVVTCYHVSRVLTHGGVPGFISRVKDIRGETGIDPVAQDIVMRRADRVIAISEATRRDVIESGMFSRKNRNGSLRNWSNGREQR